MSHPQAQRQTHWEIGPSVLPGPALPQPKQILDKYLKNIIARGVGNYLPARSTHLCLGCLFTPHSCTSQDHRGAVQARTINIRKGVNIVFSLSSSNIGAWGPWAAQGQDKGEVGWGKEKDNEARAAPPLGAVSLTLHGLEWHKGEFHFFKAFWGAKDYWLHYRHHLFQTLTTHGGSFDHSHIPSVRRGKLRNVSQLTQGFKAGSDLPSPPLVQDTFEAPLHFPRCPL